jgi:hypothetical protein
MASSARAQARVPAIDDDLHRITHAVVIDSLIGGGQLDDLIFSAVDSTSLTLLALAKVPAKLAEPKLTLRCPGNAASGEAETKPVVGYWVRVRLEPAPDRTVWRLTVFKSCEFVFASIGRTGFYEGGSWEIKKVNGVWRIVRILDRVIT